jgi:hypothetical protein
MIDALDQAVIVGAVAALRKRARLQRDFAANGTAKAGDKFPGVTIRSPEASSAINLASSFDEIADVLAAEARS